jgi:hypothetical protein
MKKPPVDELDMSVYSTGRTDKTPLTHTQNPQHVTASNAVVSGGNFPADVLGCGGGGGVDVIALRVRELFHSLYKCQRTSLTSPPAGGVSMQGIGKAIDIMNAVLNL